MSKFVSQVCAAEVASVKKAGGVSRKVSDDGSRSERDVKIPEYDDAGRVKYPGRDTRRTLDKARSVSDKRAESVRDAHSDRRSGRPVVKSERKTVVRDASGSEQDRYEGAIGALKSYASTHSDWESNGEESITKSYDGEGVRHMTIRLEFDRRANEVNYGLTISGHSGVPQSVINRVGSKKFSGIADAAKYADSVAESINKAFATVGDSARRVVRKSKRVIEDARRSSRPVVKAERKTVVRDAAGISDKDWQKMASGSVAFNKSGRTYVGTYDKVSDSTHVHRFKDPKQIEYVMSYKGQPSEMAIRSELAKKNINRRG